MQRIAELVEAERLDMELDIGGFMLRAGAGEQAELRRRLGQRAGAEQRILDAGHRLGETRAVDLVDRLDALDLVDRAQLQMVLQGLADPGPVVPDISPVRAEERRVGKEGVS